MSQEYTPVTWVDDVPGTPGTIINKARLDQMQTAHHYADGFEEVDTVPSADPGVDYHKVVYCTADSTFYRWDGTQWTKDVDDETKALLLAHEADHSNPHVVTKAQVGLGNADNTADLDKPISTATQTALDGKLDDSQLVSAWQGTPDNDHIPTEKLVKDSLDGKVPMTPKTSGVWFYAQVSSGTVQYQGTSGATGGITSVPMRDSSGRIKTAAPSANDDAANKKYVDDLGALKLDDTQLVTSWGVTPSDSNIPSEKLVKDSLDAKADASALTDGSVTKVGTANVGTDERPIKLVAGVPTAVTYDLVDAVHAQTIGGKKTFSAIPTILADRLVIESLGHKYIDFRDLGDNSISAIQADSSGLINIAPGLKTGGTKAVTLQDIRAYDASNTSDAVTIGSLQASTDVVHTTGNETIAGVKTIKSSDAVVKYKITSIDETTAPSALKQGFPIDIYDTNDHRMGGIQYAQDTDRSRRIAFQIRTNGSYNGQMGLVRDNSTAEIYGTTSYRTYNASNTSDIVTIGSLQASTDVVHITGNETITGYKKHESALYALAQQWVKSRAATATDGTNTWLDAFSWPSTSNYNHMVFEVHYSYGTLDNMAQIVVTTQNTSDTPVIYEYNSKNKSSGIAFVADWCKCAKDASGKWHLFINTHPSSHTVYGLVYAKLISLTNPYTTQDNMNMLYNVTYSTTPDTLVGEPTSPTYTGITSIDRT